MEKFIVRAESQIVEQIISVRQILPTFVPSKARIKISGNRNNGERQQCDSKGKDGNLDSEHIATVGVQD